MQICTHCSILFKLSTGTSLTRIFISRSSLSEVNIIPDGDVTQHGCPLHGLFSLIVFLRHGVSHSGGGVTTCFAFGIFSPFAFIYLYITVTASLEELTNDISQTGQKDTRMKQR